MDTVASGRFPLAVIRIHIDPYLADVNAHPTKQEVRISKEKRTNGAGFRSYHKESRNRPWFQDALENLKSTVRNREKVEANDFATERKYALLWKNEPTRPTSW